MSQKKTASNEQRLRELEQLHAAHLGRKDAECIDAVQRAARFLEQAEKTGFGPELARSSPLQAFLAEHGSPVVLGHRPFLSEEVEDLQCALGLALPGSYGDFLTEYGSAAFYRAHPEEQLSTFSPGDVIAHQQRLHAAYSLAFAQGADAYPAFAEAYGPPAAQIDDWPMGEPRLLAPPAEASSVRLVPIAPYYDGAFFLLIDATDDRGRCPVLCGTPSNEPFAFVCYGLTIVEWFSRMVDWTMIEISTWLESSFPD